jgi:hypothetical protein
MTTDVSLICRFSRKDYSLLLLDLRTGVQSPDGAHGLSRAAACAGGRLSTWSRTIISTTIRPSWSLKKAASLVSEWMP